MLLINLRNITTPAVNYRKKIHIKIKKRKKENIKFLKLSYKSA